ncbi:MAG: nucleotidyltransferase domain-containing protein [Acidobacteria bacterium]|nr:nucleotidyltransferase domain-containing protein [Acidobacteriota bacterium]
MATGEPLLDSLTAKLRKLYGDALVSVVLYGSAASGDHHPRYSDYNVLCVLAAVTPAELAAAEDLFRWWREHGNPSPLLLTEDELAASSDCFAIEFRDIREAYRLLHGRDVIAPLSLDHRFYRAQVEHELRAKLLRLRQKAAGMMSDPDLLRRLLADSVATFCVLFRHALLLRGHAAPHARRDTVAAAAAAFAFDPLPFQQLLDLREERIRPRELLPVALLPGYMKGISAVIDAVDRIGTLE